MSRRSFRIALSIVGGTILLFAIAGIMFYVVAKGYPERKNPGSGEEVVVEIRRGLAFPAIAGALADAGVIDRPRWFRFYGMRRGITAKIKPGRYVMRTDMTPAQVIARLLKGVENKTVLVKIPEGLNMLEVFALIESKGVASAEDLERLGRDSSFLKGQNIAGQTVEGYLFPEGYQFIVPTPPEKVLIRLIDQHRKVWKRLAQKNKAGLAALRGKPLEWSERNVLTMASIVEKEAVVAEERPRIAQVFINRLVKPGFSPRRLDTDPTIRYGCTVPLNKSKACVEWSAGGRLYTKQLRDKDNPYNTYQHVGLPPGPICNPGEAAMAATMNPDGSEYFFFVSRNNGTHVFSKTRAEHERAVDQFQR